MRLILTATFTMAIAIGSSYSHAEQDEPEVISEIDQFIRHHAEAIRGEESGNRELSTPFDFDGLRGKDVAVVYWIAKDNDATAYLAIFEEDDNTWSLTHQVRLGGRGLRHITDVSYSKRAITIECLEFAGHEPLSSPSLKATITATVEKGLLDIKRSQHED
jgi:hypothetical protein